MDELGTIGVILIIVVLALGYGSTVLLAWVISLIFHLEINIWLVGLLIYLVCGVLRSILHN